MSSSPETVRMLTAVVEAANGLDVQHRREILKVIKQGEAPKVQMLTTKQTCERLGASRQSLWRWEREGLLRPIRYSKRKIRYNGDEVERLLTQGDPRLGSNEAASTVKGG